MALSGDLINFDLIETHKENIQALPGGRSARQLASILSPLSSKGAGAPSFDETKTLNDAIRQEYENELLSVNDSDDPLDIYDRYVKWTLNAYPSAQATSQSQLLPLLERATKAFLTSSHYKNDPRYLKLWLHYIRLFSDSPRETFAFLARHHIGEGLGLFYEEFAAWLEGAERWAQAEEVYKLGIEREARPAERLLRKYNQFQQRYEVRPQDTNEPSSPALPTVRPALAAKIDPFAPTSRADDPQAPRPRSGIGSAANPRSGKPKMAIFSDTENAAPAPTTSTTNGWDSIGSIRERKKENNVEVRPWAGETLKAGKKIGTASKMEVFKDSNIREPEIKILQTSKQCPAVVNPKTGRAERVFVNMEAVYPNDQEEYSFEELRALCRGWSARDWRPKHTPIKPSSGNTPRTTSTGKSIEPTDIENLSIDLQEKLQVKSSEPEKRERQPKQKRMKVREVKQETQTVKTRLESPSRRKLKRKGTSEPTMTFHSKVATNEIYDMFNQPLRSQSQDDTQSGDETDYGDDTYSTAGESTGTGRASAPSSEFGDDTLAEIRAGVNDIVVTESETASPWSDSHNDKEKRNNGLQDRKHNRNISEDLTGDLDFSQDRTRNSDFGGFDTQAIANIAGQNFDDLDTQAIALLAGDREDENDEGWTDVAAEIELRTPIEEEHTDHIEIHNQPRYVPLPPEDYEPTPVRPFRDSAAPSKLPFMTPIVERTESSLAPSTVFQDADYFNSKTPSRKADLYQSPSKLNVDALQLSSPQSGSPQSVKRKLLGAAVTKEEDQSASPPKKQAVGSVVRTFTKDVGPRNSNPQRAPLSAKTAPEFHSTLEEAKSKKRPIIIDTQCNPCDSEIRNTILASIHPPLSSYAGFSDNSSDTYNHHTSLKTYADKVTKQKNNKNSPRKTQNEKTLTKATPPILKFAATNRVYAVKRELGKGAFAPVYLVDSYDPSDFETTDENESQSNSLLPTDSRRHALEALKTESPPCTLVWEFHILRLVRQRLGSACRAMESIIRTHECHLYRDEAYLILSYSPQGTLLDLVNLSRNESIRQGKTPEGLDEVLAMYFTLELLRTLEEIHRVGILHGDLKADNCLVRFDTNVDLGAPFDREGSYGWNSKGLCLIDFGRGINTKNFRPDAKFVADWPASPQDCAEIRECRPWTYQIDYHGAAGVIHSLLFGKYIETVPVAVTSSTSSSSIYSSTSTSNPSTSQPNPTENTISLGLSLGLGTLGQSKQHKLTNTLKRYWERDLWTEIFGVLLNPTIVDEPMPIQQTLRGLISKIENWLEMESEKGSRDLRMSLRRMERLVGK